MCKVFECLMCCDQKIIFSCPQWPECNCPDGTTKTGCSGKSEPCPGCHEEKFISPCDLPDVYQYEILEILIEECAEVIQRAIKMMRFGVKEIQPGQQKTNAARLSDEIGDLQMMIELASSAGLVDAQIIAKAKTEKLKKLEKYMQSIEGKLNA